MYKVPEKVYLCLFILCVILFYEIVGTSLEENIGKSSNVLVRRKRVINRLRGQDLPVEIESAPYIVNIKKHGRMHCIGTILSKHTVITAARCVALQMSAYLVFSGSEFTHNGRPHNITTVKMHGNNPSNVATSMTGIGLITVNPPFEYGPTTNNIELHAEPVIVGMHGTISGWGAYVHSEGVVQSQFCHKLRSIIVPIISHTDCLNIYRQYFPITEEEVCTYHPHKQCGFTDVGAPLVIENKLVGVHIGEIDTPGRRYPKKPDVFVLVQHFKYSQWITEHIVH